MLSYYIIRIMVELKSEDKQATHGCSLTVCFRFCYNMGLQPDDSFVQNSVPLTFKVQYSNYVKLNGSKKKAVDSLNVETNTFSTSDCNYFN